MHKAKADPGFIMDVVDMRGGKQAFARDEEEWHTCGKIPAEQTSNYWREEKMSIMHLPDEIKGLSSCL